ncbi:MAG: hydrogen gas-evolving membrane-bound hydrogenase subunit E, partial [Pseudomonadota bacterium]
RLGPDEPAKVLKLWAGVNIPLVLSLVTLTLGFALYAVHGAARRGLVTAFTSIPSMDVGWDRFLDGLKALAAWQTRVIQTGVLRNYLSVTFTVVFVGIAGGLVMRGQVSTTADFSDLTLQQAALCLLIGAGSLLAMATRSRITAVAALGVVGIGVALIFIVFGAPDVAITQLLVETLVVVLVAVGMLRLPLLDIAGEPLWRPRDAALAVAVGAVVTLTLLAVLDTPLDRRVTDFYEVASWPEAFGRNIVNVILVDFRALDTFGEIAVVVVAALAAYALLRTRPGEGTR